MSLTESIVKNASLTWFGEPGYAIGPGLHFAPGEPASRDGGRDSFGEVVLVGRLREAIQRLILLVHHSRTIITMRDPASAGLPKPLSGELSVAELS